MAVDDVPRAHDAPGAAEAPAHGMTKGEGPGHACAAPARGAPGGAGQTPSDSAELAWRSAAHYSSSSSGGSSSGAASAGAGAAARAASPSAGDDDAGAASARGARGDGAADATASAAAGAPRAGSSHAQHSDASCGYGAGDDEDLAAARIAEEEAFCSPARAAPRGGRASGQGERARAAAEGAERGEGLDEDEEEDEEYAEEGEEEEEEEEEEEGGDEGYGYEGFEGGEEDEEAELRRWRQEQAAARGRSDVSMADADAADGYAAAVGALFAPPPPRRWCVNCASGVVPADAPGAACGKCGHRPADDDALFDATGGAGGAGGAGDAASRGASPVPGASPRAADGDAAEGAVEGGGGGVILCWDDAMLLHEEDDDCPHPERPDRLRAVAARLAASGLAARARRVPARPATDAELLRAHTGEHLARLRAAADWPPGALHAAHWLPADTYMNEHTFEAALLAAGSAAEVAVAVAKGEARAGAAIIRPPGHHAESNTAMGFCFFNNAAVAARAARAAGAERVLIVDWDVHHGNGTQHIFEECADVMYMSLHRWDGGAFYPGTGAPSEAGYGAGRGYSVNVGWDGPGATDGDYELAMESLLLPVARAYAPALVIISAGFDAAAGDPIGGCRLTPAAFARMTAGLMAIAPAALLLEGGYNLSATAAATEACVRVLMGAPPPPAPRADGGGDPSRAVTLAGWRGVRAAAAVQARFWPCAAAAACAAPPPHVAEQIARQEEAEARRREALAAYEAARREDEARRAREAAARALGAASLGGGSGPLPPAPAARAQQQQQRRGASREATPAEERPWSSRFRRPSFSAAAEARLHILRTGMSRKQQLLRSLHRRALRMALKRRGLAAQRRSAAATLGAAAAGAGARACGAAGPGPEADMPGQQQQQQQQQQLLQLQAARPPAPPRPQLPARAAHGAA